MATDRTTDTPTTAGDTTRDTTRDTRTRDVGVTAGTGNRFAGGWGPVLSGAVSAFLMFAILSSLWLAIAASGVDAISDNFGWFELLSVLVAAPFGGYVAGRLQPSGDRLTASFQGFASWGLLILIGLIVGVPSGAALLSGATDLTVQGAANGSTSLSEFSEQLWGAFGVITGGAVLAALAGAAGARAGHHHDVHADRR